MIQTLSLAMSQHLSSLVPGFEGHSIYVELIHESGERIIEIRCAYEKFIINASPYTLYKGMRKICPAWQVEDALRNWKMIFKNFHSKCCDEDLSKPSTTAKDIAEFLVFDPDTAYQKIEEYLWSILT